ncbi:pyrroline-5-carboxylate reductase [Longilinea arvoryzae]|uniref:Pyrroline-5-carboxylate reductase n=1 Tax=Longilinea arvoryzae TaxID=360412 RepID=A0A0S7BMZ1_9CHLR|nr:pyrroline-5-carboxylate reductase [Longilinea arvoryzae]GAP15173.1 pyrroline-5-carboxylate reductase [Longilinea arvoryzae]
MDTTQPTIALIGHGIMGEAILSGLIRDGLTPADHILAAGPRVDRGEELRDRYGIRPFTDNRAAAEQADVVILSVKPQRLDRVLENLRGHIQPDALIISIVAGASIEKIATQLGHSCIVRSMPNTPGQIGEGITVWVPSPSVNEEQKKTVRQILGALGQEIFVEEENYLDMATALSGTGPAYVFLFLEALIDAGVHLGFPRRIAEQLVLQTVSGSVDYYRRKKAHPAALRNEVTSPGGTSAEAIYYLEKAGFRTAISRAIWAAYERSQELGKDKPTGQLKENS